MLWTRMLPETTNRSTERFLVGTDYVSLSTKNSIAIVRNGGAENEW